MQNFIQRGDAIYVPAPVGGVVSSQSLAVGKIFGVVSETVPAGTVFALWRKGVYSLPKTNAQAWAQGDALYWDAANSVVTNVNTGSLLPVGWASDPAANPSSVGNVLLGQSAS
jgi:predicted RecA/RadA family phage recombinase